MRKIIYLVLTCQLLIACRRTTNDVSPLDDKVLAVYCTPENTEECLPLEILNTPDGWEAHYGGNKEGIPLKPRIEINEEGDSLYYFDEYVDGKLNGTYRFDDNILYSYFFVGGGYKGEGGGPEIRFDGLVLRKEVVNNQWSELGNVEQHDGYLKDYCNPTCDVMQDVYKFHSDADLPNYYGCDANILTSDDGNVSIYWRTYEQPGNGPGGSSDYITMIKYRGKHGDVVIDEGLSNIWYPVVNDYEFNFTYLYDVMLQQVNINGKVVYFVELSFDDSIPMFFHEKSECQQKHAVFLFAHQIVNGKFVPARVLDGKDYVAVIVDKCYSPLHFNYDEKSGILYVPCVNKKDYSFRGEFDKIKLR